MKTLDFVNDIRLSRLRIGKQIVQKVLPLITVTNIPCPLYAP